MKDAARFVLAPGASGYWLFIKPLFSVKAKVASATFILINWHRIPLPLILTVLMLQSKSFSLLLSNLEMGDTMAPGWSRGVAQSG